MKFLILVVLAVVGAQANFFPAPSGFNLTLGTFGLNNTLFDRKFPNVPAIADTIQMQDITLTSFNGTVIAGIQAFEVAVTQKATASIIAGGVGHRSVTIRFRTARSYGYYFQCSIWGY